MTKRLEIPHISLQRHFGGFLTLYTKDGDNGKKEKRGSLTLFTVNQRRRIACPNQISGEQEFAVFSSKKKKAPFSCLHPIYLHLLSPPSEIHQAYHGRISQSSWNFLNLFSISESFSLAAPAFFQFPQLTLSARTRFLPSFVLTTAIVHQHTHTEREKEPTIMQKVHQKGPFFLLLFVLFSLCLSCFFWGEKKPLLATNVAGERERDHHIQLLVLPFLKRQWGRRSIKVIELARGGKRRKPRRIPAKLL